MHYPLLDPDELAVWLHAAVCAYWARRQGVPPDVMTAENPGRLAWTDFPADGGLDEFADEVRHFLALPRRPVFDRGRTLADDAARLHPAWLAAGGHVVFHTSGSTGEPRPHIHTAAMLRQEVESLAPAFADAARFVRTTSPFHSYGFVFGMLLPKRLGKPSVPAPSLPTVIGEALRPGDWLVAFPLLLEKLFVAPPPSVRCLSATAPIPKGLFADLRAQGFAGVAEIYGASEMGAIALRASESAPFTLLAHWDRQDSATLRRHAPRGEVERVWPLPDHVAWDGARALRPTGRVDRAVQVAGVNVYLDRVAATLREHPMVVDCAVRAMRPEEGARLKAYVVPTSPVDYGILRQSLRDFMRVRLATAERPTRLTFGDALPRTPHGKPCDWD